MKAVIQSGGKGTRLRPYTTVLPKPLMPVGTKPVLELLLTWLRRNDMREAFITTGYLGHLIKSFCGDGRQWDMRIAYTEESEPLGTVGALSLLRDELNSTFLMVNGDVLTDLNLNAFVAFHRQHGGPLTIATARRSVQIDFGILEDTNGRVTRFKEKPILTHIVSTGIYCVEPSVIDLIPKGVPFGFDNLMHCMLARAWLVRTFLHHGLWLDIGRVEDFHRAQDLALDGGSPAFEIAPVTFDTAVAYDTAVA
jgi:mannose-1-phosphate guanylyltransferase